MSVAEMKLAAITKISSLHTESAVKEILEHLEKIAAKDSESFDAKAFFNEASAKYGDILKKLAE